jgi:signal transduction histidine kinase
VEKDFAIAIDAGHIGLAHVEQSLRVASRLGRLSSWLPHEGEPCCDTALLFGMEEDLRELGEKGGSITIPGVHVPELKEGLRANVVIHANEDGSLSIITMADYGAGEIEALLTAERREKQISDEKLLAETERANAQTRIAAITQERARIARDLHDTLVQSMVGILANVRLVLKVMESNPQRAMQELGATERLARYGLESARATLLDIRSRKFATLTLGAAIRDSLGQLRARLDIDILLYMQPEADDLAGPVAEGLARVAEEALRNVERHARARHLSIALQSSGGSKARVILRISDDGVGFDATRQYERHFGLVGMSEQMSLLGGSLAIESNEGKGTVVTATAPLGH